MANHGPSYGLDAELKAKQNSKYDRVSEGKVINWINGVVGCSLTPENLHEELKSGVILCNLINTIRPGLVKKINNGKMPFIQMENINAFLIACKQLGIPPTDLFMTVDLFEAKNMGAVIDCLLFLGKFSSKISTFNGPYIE